MHSHTRGVLRAYHELVIRRYQFLLAPVLIRIGCDLVVLREIRFPQFLLFRMIRLQIWIQTAEHRIHANAFIRGTIAEQTVTDVGFHALPGFEVQKASDALIRHNGDTRSVVRNCRASW